MLRELSILLLALIAASRTALALGHTSYVQTLPSPGGFALCDSCPAALLADTNDWPGALRAAQDLAQDIGQVTGRCSALVHEAGAAGKNAVIIGTLGKSRFIERLVNEHLIDASAISNQWESFLLQVVPRPLPGIDQGLVICGSDKRGTIYGIYDVAEQIGVSPWHFWADVPPAHHDRLFVPAGRFVSGPPAVKYRGLFLNDEAPALSGWVQEKYGVAPGFPGAANYGRGFYTNLFELMLRLRANYLWPAMWNNAFNEDDPENPRLADAYGIVMGTTHQEPMLRAQKEWDRSLGRRYGNWNYNRTNQQPVLQQFWREGVRRNQSFESIFTLGLRAENDSGAPIGKSLTEQIVSLQRSLLAQEINPDLPKIPQLWCLYKEVQDYYNDGLRVPEDVTLLWAEDNWGNLRRLPSPEERKRSGGAGIYYHFDYHGGPRSYQWINTSPIPKIWDQLSLAWQYGADRIWIVNVGHFKGYEFPLEFFLHLAWDPARWTSDRLEEYTRLWAQREFGPEHADEIAAVIASYTQYNGRCKPELLDADTYSLVNYREFETVVADYHALAARAEALSRQLPAERRDAFFELVLFPVKACAQLNALYLAAAQNRLHAKQGRADANDFAAQVHALFQAQTNLMNYFNCEFAGGKWNHFMDQAHLGYTSWKDPPRNSLDAIRLAEHQPVPVPASMGITLEGSESAWPGETNAAVLPPFDSFNRQRRYVEVFNRGATPFSFSAQPSQDWIRVSARDCAGCRNVPVEKGLRVWLDVDWSKAPGGAASGKVTFSGPGGSVDVSVDAVHPIAPSSESLQGFVESDGYVSMEAEHCTASSEAGACRWLRIPRYGHTLSGMRADGPADVEAAPGSNSPCLQYQMHLFRAGRVEVDAIVGPTLNFLPGRALRYAVAFDADPPQVLTVVPANFNAQNGNRDWEESVRNGCRHSASIHTLSSAGCHTLKIWMVDPGVVLQKMVVNTGGLKPSFLGPPESFHSNCAALWSQPSPHPRPSP